MPYKVKNWVEFQHYKDRSPPWVKLHKTLLDNYDFHCLPVASRALAPMLWLLASESQDGTFTSELRKISFRLHMTESELKIAIKPLQDAGFIEFYSDASNALAPVYQGAIPETETEKEAKTETEKKKESPYSKDFEDWWKAYPPNAGSKRKAFEIYQQAIKKGNTHDQLRQSAINYGIYANATGTPIAHATTWLNQSRWEIDYAKLQAIASGSSREIAGFIRPQTDPAQTAHDAAQAIIAKRQAAREEAERRPEGARPANPIAIPDLRESGDLW